MAKYKPPPRAPCPSSVLTDIPHWQVCQAGRDKTSLLGRGQNCLNWDLQGTWQVAPIPALLRIHDLGKLCLPSTPLFFPPEHRAEQGAFPSGELLKN